jgi:hypothetical protein
MANSTAISIEADDGIVVHTFCEWRDAILWLTQAKQIYHPLWRLSLSSRMKILNQPWQLSKSPRSPSVAKGVIKNHAVSLSACTNCMSCTCASETKKCLQSSCSRLVHARVGYDCQREVVSCVIWL